MGSMPLSRMSRMDTIVCHAQQEFKKAAEASQKSKKQGLKRLLPFQILLGEAPQIRVRNLNDRQQDQLGELVIANERLAGRHGAEARHTVEFLKRDRERWEQVYNILVKGKAAATLADLQNAHRQVAELMSETSRESKTVAELKLQLVDLQQQVSAAHQKLHHTQELVQLNKDRIQQLTSQAQPATRNEDETSSSHRDSLDGHAERSSVSDSLAIPRIVPAEEPLTRSAWLPVAFSETVTDGMTKISHAGQPWILFRDASGQAACIEDCCAHRACPLSLGKMTNGKPTCAYHGWQYNKEGECTEMPSTRFRCGIKVNSLVCQELDGMIWVGDPQLAPEISTPSNHTRIPPGFQVVTRTQADVPLDKNILEVSLLAQGSLLTDWEGAKQPCSTYRIQPGWVLCATGHDILEIHILSSAIPGQCRWLYQIWTSKSWGHQPLVRQLRQREADQLMEAFLKSIDSSVSQLDGHSHS